MHSPFVEMIRTVVRRGVASGDFRVAVDPVQLYISIAALGFFYLSNSATLSVIFGRDLLGKEARDERLAHMVALVLAALTGKSAALFGAGKDAGPAFPRTSYRLARAARAQARKRAYNLPRESGWTVFIQRVNLCRTKSTKPGSDAWPSLRAQRSLTS